MSSPSARLGELGLTLPAVATPLAAYVPAVRVGQLVFTAGQLPSVEGHLAVTGKVGAEVSPDEAAACAGVAVLNGLAAIAAEVGGLDAIVRVVKVTVFVASDPGFTGHAHVANGASQLLRDVFGAVGQHARSAVGVAVLPLDSPVEVELVVEVAATPTVRPL
ncbi:RidA family protein [uncultured Friedmanniella sp.]|uniref:RidA family protein n=1 Tax=uncultured Friedmanniella sp. TaxID=335381 RepID=UPI0035CC7CB0